MADTKLWEEYISCIEQRFNINFQTGAIVSKKTGEVMDGMDAYGYIQVHIGYINGKRKMMKGHQVVYLMYHGDLPEDSIDHFDRCRTHNFISNLCPSNPLEQAQNRGVSGVRQSGRYYVAKKRLKSGKMISRKFVNEAAALKWVGLS